MRENEERRLMMFRGGLSEADGLKRVLEAR